MAASNGHHILVLTAALRRAAIVAMIAAAWIAVCEVHPAAADGVDRTEARPTSIAAYGGWFVWSHWVSTGREYRLVASDGVAVRTLPVPGRKVPFDVDLGPDEHGHTVATYSRCAKEPFVPSVGLLPNYRTGVRCRLYQVRVPGGSEQRIRVPVGNSQSVFLPTRWHHALAYGLSDRGRYRIGWPPVPRVYMRFSCRRRVKTDPSPPGEN